LGILEFSVSNPACIEAISFLYNHLRFQGFAPWDVGCRVRIVIRVPSCCLFLWLFGKNKCRGSARLTNLGQLLESKGVELLGSQYANPIDSYSAFQRWSVQHPEVCLSAKSEAQLWWYLILIKQISSSKIVDRDFYVALHFSCPF
jgi:hypothetical protein